MEMEIEKLSKTIADNQKKIEKLQRQLEKAKEEKETKRQYEKNLKIEVENDLKNCFYNCFEREGFEKGLIHLSLKATRDDIIKNVGENKVEKNFIDNNYEKTLNKVKKIYENDQKAKNAILSYQLHQQQIQEQKQKEKDQKYLTALSIIGNILKWSCIILFCGIYLIFKFVSDLAKKR